MPRKYKQKTDRGTAQTDVLKRAAERVTNGETIRSVAKDFNINRMTLKRYIVKLQNNPEPLTGYASVAAKHLAIPREMESDLASHIKHLASMFQGLSPKKCCEVAYEFALKNNLKVPDNWLTNKRAGTDWWIGFKSRNNLAIKCPEATSINHPVVSQVNDNLTVIMDKYGFKPEVICSIDETGCITVQEPENVVTYVSPSDVLPVPRAGPRKQTEGNHTKGSTKVLTDTSIQNSIADALSLQCQKTKTTAEETLLKKSRTPVTQVKVDDKTNSDQESEMEDDESTDEATYEEVLEGNEATKGDFVVVKVAGKSRTASYIARIDVVDNDDFEGVFLKKVPGKVNSKETSFVPNTDDPAFFSREEIICKLPQPKTTAGSARQSSSLVFRCNFDQWLVAQK